MECIAYKKGYKYQLKQPYVTNIDIRPEGDIDIDFITLTKQGELTIKKGYAWDGPSGPTFDTLNFMRGSLVHDALYQLMRNRYLDDKIHRKSADRLLRTLCRQDGMTAIRVWWIYHGLRFGGGPAADPAYNKPVIRAPGACQFLEQKNHP